MNIELAKLVAADIRDGLIFSESSEINQAPEYIDVCERVVNYDPLNFDLGNIRERITQFLEWPEWPIGHPMRYSSMTMEEAGITDKHRIAISDAFIYLKSLLS